MQYFTYYMKFFIMLFIGVGSIFLHSYSAIAASIEYEREVILKKTNWNTAIEFPKHNPTSGLLDSITFTLQSAMTGALKIESTDSSAHTFTSTLGASTLLTRPNTTPIIEITPSKTNTDTFAFFDGVLDYSGPSGTIHQVTNSETKSQIFTNLSAADLAIFVGNGMVTLPIHSQGVSSFIGGGNLQSESELYSSAKVKVRYTYLTPDLAIAITGNTNLNIGLQHDFVLTVQNIGSRATYDKTIITTTLPSGVKFVSAQGAGSTCTALAQVVTCIIDQFISAGQTFHPITITASFNSNAIPSVILQARVVTSGDFNEQNGVNSNNIIFTVGSPTTVTNNRTTIANSTTPELTFGELLVNNNAYGEAISPTTSLIDAQGCTVPDKYTIPTKLSSINTCFQFVPDRSLFFNDVATSPEKRFIETLKNTQIKSSGDFIVSGVGNHSTGNNQADLLPIEYSYSPLITPTRFEVIKIALIANCLTIEQDPFDQEITFKDVQKEHTTNESYDFLNRVVYTGTKQGIITGYNNGLALPLQKVTNAEALVMLLRAAHAFPTGYLDTPNGPWYTKYIDFALANNLIDSNFKPAGSMNRAQLAKLVVHIMALNPDTKISGYIAQLEAENQKFTPHELLYTPIPRTNFLTPDVTLDCNERGPIINSCLDYNPNRAIAFNDVSPVNPQTKFINLLKNTFIIATGDYIFSGIGNHSTGKQQLKYQSGVWPFDPTAAASRLEVVKTALVANCLPIEDYVPVTNITFSDIPQTRNADDDLADFTARVFYTAAQYGIIKGYTDGAARPQQKATYLEAMTILLRSADAIPKDYKAKKYQLPALPMNNEWYVPSVSFAINNGIIPFNVEDLSASRFVNRSELAMLLAQIMQFSADLRIRSYRTAVNAIVQ